MPGTTPNNALRYPLSTEAPDGPGGFLNLATDVDNLVASGTWAPILGGTGAAIGTNPGYEGSWSRVGKNVQAKGRIVFGSSASFGTGTATVSGLPGTVVVARSAGYGYYIPVTGNPIPVFFVAVDGANLAIRPVVSASAGTVSSLGVGSAIGTPVQSSELRFSFDLTLV